MAQRVKDPAWSLLWLEFDPWPRNFYMPWAWPKGKKKVVDWRSGVKPVRDRQGPVLSKTRGGGGRTGIGGCGASGWMHGLCGLMSPHPHPRWERRCDDRPADTLTLWQVEQAIGSARWERCLENKARHSLWHKDLITKSSLLPSLASSLKCGKLPQVGLKALHAEGWNCLSAQP